MSQPTATILRCERCGDLIDIGSRCARCRGSKTGDLPGPRVFVARFIQGLSYPILALSLLRSRAVRRFVLLPVLINALLFAALLVGGIIAYPHLFDAFVTSAEGFWADLLQWLIFPFVLSALLVIFFFTFVLVGTVVAGPFLEPISRRVETEVLGAPAADEDRGIVRETIYSVTQAGGMLLLGLASLLIILPLTICFPFAAPFAFLLASWVAAVEYLDSSLARKRYPLRGKLGFVLRNKAITLGFGVSIQALLLVPGLNLLVLPLGAVAGTILYLDTGRK